jgi:hypothetical protein
MCVFISCCFATIRFHVDRPSVNCVAPDWLTHIDCAEMDESTSHGRLRSLKIGRRPGARGAEADRNSTNPNHSNSGSILS